MSQKTLEELINRDDPGWTLVKEWISQAKNHVEILPREQAKADKALVRTQVTTRSPMGAVIWETGGILVDHGWLRILGSGCAQLDRSLPEWNQGRNGAEVGKPPPFLLIADDVVGGFFAINGGGLDSTNLGKVFYFAPDSLRWENLKLTYSDFLLFCFSGDLGKFYKTERWEGWQQEIKSLKGTQAISCYPPMWTKEGKDLNKVSRKPVPVSEVWGMQQDVAKQLDSP